MYAIGIDVGGTTLKGGMVDVGGVIEGEVRVVKTLQDRDKFLESLFRMLDEILSLKVDKVLGIGLGIPGVIDNFGNISCAYNVPLLEGLKLSEIVEKRYNLRVVISNDASNATMGEYLFGSGNRGEDMILLTLGTGIGGGIIIDGDVFKGAHNYGGELGHIKVEPEGIECSCGGRGCLESYASSKALIQHTLYELEMGIGSRLNKYRREEIDVKLISDLAKGGDGFSINVIKRCGYYIGLVLSSLINGLDICHCVIGGGISQSGEILLKSIRQTVLKNVLEIHKSGYKIELSKLGVNGGIIGSASHFFK